MVARQRPRTGAVQRRARRLDGRRARPGLPAAPPGRVRRACRAGAELRHGPRLRAPALPGRAARSGDSRSGARSHLYRQPAPRRRPLRDHRRHRDDRADQQPDRHAGLLAGRHRQGLPPARGDRSQQRQIAVRHLSRPDHCRRSGAHAGSQYPPHRPHPDRRQPRAPRAGHRRNQLPLPVRPARPARLRGLGRLRIQAADDDRGRPWLDAQMTPREMLRTLFDAAIAAADPARCVPPYLPPDDGGRLIVIGAGKASAAMAQAVERLWSGPLDGLVVTRYGHGVPCERIEIVEAAHPVPDAAGELAAQRILDKVRGLTENDRVLALISGGGSALLAAPAAGITLAEKRAITSSLLRSGASIGEINCVRKHLSAIKGGRLAVAAWPASVLTLAISDVPGDDPAVIASGPTVADPSTALDALKVLDSYAIDLPPSLRWQLEEGELETPKAGDPHLARSVFRLVASPRQMLEAAAEAALQMGL